MFFWKYLIPEKINLLTSLQVEIKGGGGNINNIFFYGIFFHINFNNIQAYIWCTLIVDLYMLVLFHRYDHMVSKVSFLNIFITRTLFSHLRSLYCLSNVCSVTKGLKSSSFLCHLVSKNGMWLNLQSSRSNIQSEIIFPLTVRRRKI